MHDALNTAMAVFSRGDDIALLEISEAATERALAEGYVYCGSIAIHNGKPEVKCMPGDAAASAMWQAGYHFAGWLGPRLKEVQLEQRRLEYGAEEED